MKSTTCLVARPVLMVYFIKTFISESVLVSGTRMIILFEVVSELETDLRKPVRFFANTTHRDVAISASAITAHPKAKYIRY